MSDIETDKDELPRQESASDEESQIDVPQQASSSDSDAVHDKEAGQITTGEEATDEEATNEEAKAEEQIDGEYAEDEEAQGKEAESKEAEEAASEEIDEEIDNGEAVAESPPTEHAESTTEPPADSVSPPQHQTTSSPDIDHVNAADWPEREFPVDEQRQEGSVSVVIKQSVLEKIHEHGLVDTDVEICGVMIGNGYRDSHGPFVYVEDIIKGKHSESQTAQVTFTADTWNHIHNELDNKHPDLRILGWYHTHPGFGIFLSGMDLFIHENYFSADEQLALVYDPIGGDEGLFIWRSGEATRDEFIVEPDANYRDPDHTDAGATYDAFEQSDPGPIAEVPADYGEQEELIARIEQLEQRQWSMAITIFALALFALVSPMITWVFFIEPQLPEIFKGLQRVEESSALPTPIADPEAGPPAEPPIDTTEKTKVFKPKISGDSADRNTKEPTSNQ